MFHHVGYNDVVFLASQIYLCFDVWIAWDSFRFCNKPIHVWWLASCACVIAFRLMRMLTSLATSHASTATEPSGAQVMGGRLSELLFESNHKGFMPQVLSSFTWLVAVPFFTVWNFVGTAWLYDILQQPQQCIPTPTHVWLFSLWLLLCYYWIIVHLALCIKVRILKLRVKRASSNLREIQNDTDVLQRWGAAFPSAQATLVDAAASAGMGLSPDEIKALPCELLDSSELIECSICITTLEPGDSIRRLPSCGHTFHRSCIDPWLVRQGDCPLCKRQVLAIS